MGQLGGSRWTLMVCPECGLQAPRGYECSGGGDSSHPLNVPAVEVEVMPVFQESRQRTAAAYTELRRAIVEHRTAITNAGSIKVQPGYEKVAEVKHRADERLWKAVEDA